MRRPDMFRLYCFSPPVMMLTMVVEVVLLVRTLYMYRSDTTVRLIAAILFFLAVFQLAEYNVCEGAFGVDSLTWSRIGYAAITTLPALGIHLISSISGRKMNMSVVASYALMSVFMGYYLFANYGLTSSACLGNYVIFEVNPAMNNFYAAYYYGLEILAAVLAWKYSNAARSSQVRQSLNAMIIAYLSLLVPTTTVNLMNPETIRGIPSIMCGFAVIFALILGLYVLPRVAVANKK